jgi:5'-nucleotidase (lipoprotein e(P4) family)
MKLNRHTYTLYFLLASFIITCTNCSDKKHEQINKSVYNPDLSRRVSHDDETIMSVLYQQEAAEYRALCFQAYNLAHVKLEQELKELKNKEIYLPIAIVTDLDETALDNSDYYGELYKENTTYNTENWSAWCKTEKADSIPGSVTFFHYADKQKVQIFYISNRDTSLVESTMSNMKALGFPQIKKDHFLFRTNTSSKEARRKEVSKSYYIALLLGDNLNDFDSTFEHKTINDRLHEANNVKNIWGDRFIVFPNAIYGEWENALYNYKSNLTIEQKDSIRVLQLRGY